MKPQIFKQKGYWYVHIYNGESFVYRRCYTWGIAVEQLHRLYGMGDVIREAA